MAGHSKWANIKHRKAATDAKRGKAFTKIAKEITVAARLGGGDPSANPRLRIAVQAGRAMNMPGENIKRAIQKGTGELEGQQLEEMTFEGYGPGGIGVLIECVSDNRNRTVADVRLIFTKNGGSMAEAGAVAWNFQRRSAISVGKGGRSEEDVMTAVMDAGAEDVREGEEAFEVIAPVESFDAVRTALEAAGFDLTEATLAWVPTTTLELSGSDAAAALKLLDMLDDNDDVQQVYTNLEIADEEMARLG